MRGMSPLAMLVVLVTLAGCQSAPAGLSDTDKAAIRSASQKYVEAANAQDVDAWIQLVSESAVYMPENHAPLEIAKTRIVDARVDEVAVGHRETREREGDAKADAELRLGR